MSTSQEFLAFANHNFGAIFIESEGRKMLQEHFFDFLSKTFGKRGHFKIVLKENKGEPFIIE